MKIKGSNFCHVLRFSTLKLNYTSSPISTSRPTDKKKTPVLQVFAPIEMGWFGFVETEAVV
jgi:hypothetical protein